MWDFSSGVNVSAFFFSELIFLPWVGSNGGQLRQILLVEHFTVLPGTGEDALLDTTTGLFTALLPSTTGTRGVCWSLFEIQRLATLHFAHIVIIVVVIMDVGVMMMVLLLWLLIVTLIIAGTIMMLTCVVTVVAPSKPKLKSLYLGN